MLKIEEQLVKCFERMVVLLDAMYFSWRIHPCCLCIVQHYSSSFEFHQIFFGVILNARKAYDYTIAIGSMRFFKFLLKFLVKISENQDSAKLGLRMPKYDKDQLTLSS